MSKVKKWATRLYYSKEAQENWTKKQLERYEGEWEKRGFTMITWPDSQRIMLHPCAVLEYDVNLYGSCAYWCPTDVWEEYCTSYYDDEEE